MKSRQVGILDYDLGNTRSIRNAVKQIGAEAVLSRDHESIKNTDCLIIPGVGAFSHAMKKLNNYGLVDLIYEYASLGRPILGICLGMQMLMDESDEFGRSKGLGLVKGVVRRLPLTVTDQYRIPHVSWNHIYPPAKERWSKTIFSSLNGTGEFYFVHSYIALPSCEANILSFTEYGGCEFASAVKNGNIYGCQFHPEKSGVIGLSVIKEFVELSERSGG
jgi:glutamine amidotransferase